MKRSTHVTLRLLDFYQFGVDDDRIPRIPTDTLLTGMYLFRINGENRVLVKEK